MIQKLNKQLEFFCNSHGYKLEENNSWDNGVRWDISVDYPKLRYMVFSDLKLLRRYMKETDLEPEMWSNFSEEYCKDEIHKFISTKHLLRWLKKDIKQTIKRNENKVLKKFTQ
jgi:hypothetical protein